MSNPIGVSLIICTYNGASRLPDTIDHVNKQIVPSGISWELIVIDNSSEDDSSFIAVQSWTRDSTPIKIVVEKQKGLIYARHRGIKEASYEYITFIDDDNWIDPNWITNIFLIFHNNPDVGMCGGRNYGVFKDTPPAWFGNFEASFAIGKQGSQTGDITKTLGQLWGAGMSFRKSAYEKIIRNGFQSVLTGRQGNSLLAGEDTELSFAFRLAGWKLWYSEDLTLQHFIPSQRFNWSYIKKMYTGFGLSHAIFDIYRMAIFNQKWSFINYYLKIIIKFSPLTLWRIGHWKRSYPGNKNELQYIFHLNKLTKALLLFRTAPELYASISRFRDNISQAD